MTDPHDSVLLRFIARVFMVPYIFLFALYVLFHGESSPGGGFQAGAVFAAGMLLVWLTFGASWVRQRFSMRLVLTVAAAGPLIFVGTGVVSLVWGGNFLDYGVLPVGGVNEVLAEERTSRAIGIFFVELGIALGVFGVFALIFDQLVERKPDA